MATCLLVHPGAELFGADRMLLESAIGIKQSGFDCFVALPDDGPLISALELEGIEAVTIPMLVLRRALLRPQNWLSLLYGAMTGLSATWKTITRTQPDCIYVSTITLPQWPLIARLRGIPCITHVHEAEGYASRWVNMALYLPHLAATSIVANSQFSFRTIEKSLPLLAKRVTVIANGIAGPPTAPEAPRASLDGVLNILYLGRLSPRKGPDLIIRAAEMLRGAGAGVDVRLVLAGSTFAGYEWYEAELRAALRSSGFPEDEVLVGFQESIWPLLEDCDVLIVPSRLDESFGNTAVEGVLAYRPIIVSDPIGLREAVSGYPTSQIVPRDDPDMLFEALERLIEDWDANRGMVGTSAGLARSRHSPELYRRRISEFIAQRVVSQPDTKD